MMLLARTLTLLLLLGVSLAACGEAQDRGRPDDNAKQAEDVKAGSGLADPISLPRDGGDDYLLPFGIGAATEVQKLLGEKGRGEPITFTIVATAAAVRAERCDTKDDAECEGATTAPLATVSLLADHAAAKDALRLGGQQGLALCNAMIETPDPDWYYNSRRLQRMEAAGGAFGCGGNMGPEQAVRQVYGGFVDEQAPAPQPSGILLDGMPGISIAVTESNRDAFRLAKSLERHGLLEVAKPRRHTQLCNMVVVWHTGGDRDLVQDADIVHRIARGAVKVCPDATKPAPAGLMPFAGEDDAKSFPKLLPALDRAGIKYVSFEDGYWIAAADKQEAVRILVQITDAKLVVGNVRR